MRALWSQDCRALFLAPCRPPKAPLSSPEGDTIPSEACNPNAALSLKRLPTAGCRPVVPSFGKEGLGVVARQQCSTYLFNRLCPYLFRYHPRRCAPHPSFPKEGTTLDARRRGPRRVFGQTQGSAPTAGCCGVEKQRRQGVVLSASLCL